MLLSADGVGTNEMYARHRHIQDLRLALAAALHGGGHGRPAGRQDPSLAHSAAGHCGGRACSGPDADRAAGRNHALGQPPPWLRPARSASARCTRIWRSHGLRPHQIRQFKLSNDPNFAAKVRDIVGLYVNPPEHAVVLSVDEKSQIQALDRTQPGLPMKKGRCGTMTHDYKRNGTTTLFAAFNVLEGSVIGRCMQRHTHQEFIRFLNAIENQVPATKQVHVVLDNYATHKHPKVIEWLGRHERFTFHFTPTSASWINAVEGFFAKLTNRRLKRGVFHSHRRPTVRHQPLCQRGKREPKALPMDQEPGRNHRRSAARAPSVRFAPLGPVN